MVGKSKEQVFRGSLRDRQHESAKLFGDNLKSFHDELTKKHNTDQEALDALKAKQKEVLVSAHKYFTLIDVDHEVIELISNAQKVAETHEITIGSKDVKHFKDALGKMLTKVNSDLKQYAKDLKVLQEELSPKETTIMLLVRQKQNENEIKNRMENNRRKLTVLQDASTIVNESTAQNIKRNVVFAATMAVKSFGYAIITPIVLALFTIALTVTTIPLYIMGSKHSITKNAFDTLGLTIFAAPIAVILVAIQYKDIMFTKAKDLDYSQKNELLETALNKAIAGFEAVEKIEQQLIENKNDAPRTNSPRSSNT